MIVGAAWWRTKDEIQLVQPKIYKTGEYLRLGHLYEKKIVYSEGWEGPHQPFQDGDDRYYTDDAPHGKIYKNGELFLSPSKKYSECGKPWVDSGYIYFEQRRENENTPFGWEVWRERLETGEREFLVKGANPCVWNGLLVYSVWNGGKFVYSISDRLDHLSTYAYV